MVNFNVLILYHVICLVIYEAFCVVGIYVRTRHVESTWRCRYYHTDGSSKVLCVINVLGSYGLLMRKIALT
jgi:hypothetical protein